MCLPFTGQPALLLPPNERALQYGNVFKYFVLIQFIISILDFLSVNILIGILDLVLCGVGHFSVRSPDQGYNVQQLLCFTIFGIIRSVWSCMTLIGFLAGVSSSSSGGIYLAMVINTCIGPMYYLISTYIAYTIYNELRVVSITYRPPPQTSSGKNAFPAPGDVEYQPPGPTNGFQPFKGPGYKLGTA